MDFHAKNRSWYNVLWMHVDGFSLKYIEEKWPLFKEEPRNVRLSLEVDGVNPFGEIHFMYSMWPTFL